MALNADVMQLSAGQNHTCAIVGEEQVAKCWGLGENGRLGNGKIESSNTPVDVVHDHDGDGSTAMEPLKKVTDIAAGGQHTCAIVAGKVKCWGNNAKGQQGDGATGGDVLTPTQI